MKDYIDLTQLPPERIDRMVEELNRNDFRGLKRFCDELGILYGYPLEEVVNVFSNDLMMDKRGLHFALENFSHKHAVELLQNLIDLFSRENTPLSVTEQLSLDLNSLAETVGRLSGEIISDLQGDILISCQALSNDLSALISSQISTVYKTLDDLDISDLSDAIKGISFGENLLAKNENGIIDIQTATATYVEGYVNGKLEDFNEELSSHEIAIHNLNVNSATKEELNGKINTLYRSIPPAVKEYIDTRCGVNLAEMIRRVNEISVYVKEELSGLFDEIRIQSSVISNLIKFSQLGLDERMDKLELSVSNLFNLYFHIEDLSTDEIYVYTDETGMHPME